MKSSLAESLRRAELARVRALPPTDRLKLALRLGRQAIASFASAHGLSWSEAARTLARNRQAGRRYSNCLRELLR